MVKVKIIIHLVNMVRLSQIIYFNKTTIFFKVAKFNVHNMITVYIRRNYKITKLKN